MASALRAFFLHPSLARTLLVPALVFIACGIDRNYQTDLYHHLARGKVILEEGRLLDEDRFTYTVPGKPFIDVNWGSQVGFYGVFKAAGTEGVQVLNAVLLTLTVGVMVGLCWARSRSMRPTAPVCLVLFVGLWQFFLVRPQTFSFLLFVLTYAALEGSEKQPWVLALPPVLVGLWANLHGAFPIGIVLVGCYLLSAILESAWRDRRKVFRARRVWLLAACLAGTALATLANPYGWRVYEYVAGTSGTASARGIDEWRPPGLHTLAGPVFFASLAAVAILLVLPGRRPTVREVVLLLVFLPPAFGGVRMVAWWLLVAAPVAAGLLADRGGVSPAPPEPPSKGGALLSLALLAGMVLSVPQLEHVNPLFWSLRSPHRVEYDLEDACQAMRATAESGNVFTRFEWSEYLTWRLGRDYPVFMDGRIEIFPDEVWDDYRRVTTAADGWDELLDRHEVKFLLLDEGPYHALLLPRVESLKSKWARADLSGPVRLYRRVR